jgi:hypothetical protein
MRLVPSLREERNDPSSSWDGFLSIFKVNPHLLNHPRSLIIEVQEALWGKRRNPKLTFSPHFFSAVLRFLVDNLCGLEHLDISLDGRANWTDLQGEFQDITVDCLRGKRNNLKSLRVHRIGLPREFGLFLPSTLKACSLGVPLENDPAAVPRPTDAWDVADAASPVYLEILSRDSNSCQWVQSQKDSFFRRLSYLDIGTMSLSKLEELKDRIPDTFTHLCVRHGVVRSCKSTNTLSRGIYTEITVYSKLYQISFINARQWSFGVCHNSENFMSRST